MVAFDNKGFEITKCAKKGCISAGCRTYVVVAGYDNVRDLVKCNICSTKYPRPPAEVMGRHRGAYQERHQAPRRQQAPIGGERPTIRPWTRPERRGTGRAPGPLGSGGAGTAAAQFRGGQAKHIQNLETQLAKLRKEANEKPSQQDGDTEMVEEPSAGEDLHRAKRAARRWTDRLAQAHKDGDDRDIELSEARVAETQAEVDRLTADKEKSLPLSDRARAAEKEEQAAQDAVDRTSDRLAEIRESIKKLQSEEVVESNMLQHNQEKLDKAKQKRSALDAEGSRPPPKSGNLLQEFMGNMQAKFALDGGLQPEAKEKLLQHIAASLATMATSTEAAKEQLKTNEIRHPLQQPQQQAGPAGPSMHMGNEECDAFARVTMGKQAMEALSPEALQEKRDAIRAPRQVTRPPNGEPDDNPENKKAKKGGEEGIASDA